VKNLTDHIKNNGFDKVKQLLFTLLFGGLSMAVAQTPGIPYQAYIIDTNGGYVPGEQIEVPLANAKILLQFEIRDDKGEVEYRERIPVTTDEYGLVTTVIGIEGNGGTPVFGSFSDIDWNGKQKRLYIDIDFSGAGDDFVDHGDMDIIYIPGPASGVITNETTSTLKYNGDGSYTYTDEDGLDDTANVVSTAADNLLSVGADGGAFLNQSIAGGVSAGYRVWEFSSGVEDTYMYNDLGFLTSIWNAIPFNSTPVLVNSTGNPQEFTFNADGSIGLEAGHVYRISVSLGLHKPGDSGLRLVEQGNSSNVLATSIDEYTFYYDTVAVRMEAIISPTTTANYNVEFYYTNSGTIIRTAQTRYNQIIPRATFQIEVLN